MLTSVFDTLSAMRIGYARVSTRDQHPETQYDALLAAGCEQGHIYIDKVSGKLARRPELDKALLVLREGDQLVVTKLDRLGRSLAHLIELSAELQRRGVALVVLDQGIDTSTAVGRMFFQILGAIAEFEHALMSERTMDGLAAARARGRTGGQKPKLGPRQIRLARQMYDETGDDGKRRYTVAEIAAEFGVTRPTIYRALSNAEDSHLLAKAFTFVVAPALIGGTLGTGVPAVGHQHPASLAHQPGTSYALLTGDRSDPLHNEPIGEFIHLDAVPTMGTASTMHGPQV
jgi:DNA invertase Pin-like site-specific DNA recombinase